MNVNRIELYLPRCRHVHVTSYTLILSKLSIFHSNCGFEYKCSSFSSAFLRIMLGILTLQAEWNIEKILQYI